MRACMHACMRACVHACVRACIRACIRAYVHTCIRAYMCACVHTCKLQVRGRLHRHALHTSHLTLHTCRYEDAFTGMHFTPHTSHVQVRRRLHRHALHTSHFTRAGTRTPSQACSWQQPRPVRVKAASGCRDGLLRVKGRVRVASEWRAGSKGGVMLGVGVMLGALIRPGLGIMRPRAWQGEG